MNTDPVNPSNLSEIVFEAWNKTLERVRNDQVRLGDSDQVANTRRARVWVDALAREFAEEYDRPNFHVFWKFNPSEKNPICGKLKELLFDIVVCQLGDTESLELKPRGLKFVSQSHWLVESEFEKNTREILLDLSKLVLGAAKYKMFVASHRRKKMEHDLLDRLAPIARCCSSSLFFTFVSHPEEWFSDGQCKPVIYRWSVESDSWLLFTG